MEVTSNGDACRSMPTPQASWLHDVRVCECLGFAERALGLAFHANPCPCLHVRRVFEGCLSQTSYTRSNRPSVRSPRSLSVQAEIRHRQRSPSQDRCLSRKQHCLARVFCVATCSFLEIERRCIQGRSETPGAKLLRRCTASGREAYSSKVSGLRSSQRHCSRC